MTRAERPGGAGQRSLRLGPHATCGLMTQGPKVM